MIQALAWCDRHLRAALLGILALLALAILVVSTLAGCAQPAPIRGSAQDQAASATARAASLAASADAAEVAAATKHAAAQELETAAHRQPTPERLERAAEATSAARIADAVAAALRAAHARANAEAQSAAVLASSERQAEDAAKDLRRWQRITRAAGTLGVAGGCLLGAVLGWLISVRVGVYAGAVLVCTGLLVAAYGSTNAWSPGAVLVALAAVMGTWAWHHRRHRQPPPA